MKIGSHTRGLLGLVVLVAMLIGSFLGVRTLVVMALGHGGASTALVVSATVLGWMLAACLYLDNKSPLP